MPYYELDIPNYSVVRNEIDKIINNSNQNLKTDVSYITPRHLFEEAKHLQKMMSTLVPYPEFKLRYLTVIVNPGEQLHPHRDETEYPWNLLLPVNNTEVATLSFYKCDAKPILIDRTNERGEYVPYWGLDQSKCIETHSLILTRPTFINAHRIHGVINHSENKQRQTVSIHMSGEFSPLNLKERLLHNV